MNNNTSRYFLVSYLTSNGTHGNTDIEIKNGIFDFVEVTKVISTNHHTTSSVILSVFELTEQEYNRNAKKNEVI